MATHFSRRGLAATMAVLALAAFAQAVHSQPTEPPEAAGVGATARARQALDASNPAGALAALDADASAPGFPQLFLRGAAWQALARSAGDGVQREQAWAEAARAYRQALALNPQSAAAYTNLALLATAQGDGAAARQWYQKAADGPATRGGLYALNYARYLESQGELGPAIDYATRAWRAAPTGTASRQTLASLYLKSPADDRLAGFLAQALAGGETSFALATALDALQPANARPPEQRKSLLLIAAASMARDPVQLAKAPDDALLRQLRAASDDSEIGSAAQQLLQVLSDPPESAQAVSQWRSDSPRIAAKPPLTPRSEMRHLLQGLAAQRGKRDLASGERWLRVAVDMGDHGPDADAFLQLVGLLANSGRLAELRPLMDRYQGALFSEKSGAYARGDWPEIFRLHLALGMTYAQMKTWTSQEPYQNAIFQLEHARLAAEQAGGTGADRLALPPAATMQLAQGYTATGEVKKATMAKLDGVECLQQAQRTVEGGDVLKAIRPEEIHSMDDAAREKFRRLANDAAPYR